MRTEMASTESKRGAADGTTEGGPTLLWTSRLKRPAAGVWYGSAGPLTQPLE
jgi:hypothetical protein